MFKRISSQFLVNLGEMEGDYRVFHLKDDIAHSTLYMSIAIISALSMFRMDVVLYEDNPDMVLWLILYRGGYILVTILVLIAIRKTSKVRIYDRLVLIWMSITILFLLFFNFTRPVNFLNTAFDVIVLFGIYIFSPLKPIYTIALALSFSMGTLYIDHFYKSGIDPLTGNTLITAQLIVHALGLVSGLQIQSYRRKSFKAYMQEKDARELVAYLANIDPLTKSLTRRQFFNIAESEFLRFLRYHRQLSMLVLDADHFKNINDTYGHYAGDLVLRNLSLVILEQKRAQDTFGRLGGEEFGLLLPETNLTQAKIVATRIQKICEQTPCTVDGKLIYSTISIGAAEAGVEDKSFEDILRRADRMMYKAKEAGRNTVIGE
ncbi:MAG TPA: GGDEF domain-containing protein [Anaerolineales bacterium]|nr:GGDEF domain-containing protein [Anaerolineales bacterium]